MRLEGALLHDALLLVRLPDEAAGRVAFLLCVKQVNDASPRLPTAKCGQRLTPREDRRSVGHVLLGLLLCLFRFTPSLLGGKERRRWPSLLRAVLAQSVVHGLNEVLARKQSIAKLVHQVATEPGERRMLHQNRGIRCLTVEPFGDTFHTTILSFLLHHEPLSIGRIPEAAVDRTGGVLGFLLAVLEQDVEHVRQSLCLALP
eukprot:scaffold48_cov311-Pinguiococcus_pyrenoidosus.AAC.244